MKIARRANQCILNNNGKNLFLMGGQEMKRSYAEAIKRIWDPGFCFLNIRVHMNAHTHKAL